PSYVISIDEVDGDAAARGEAIAEPPQGGGEAGIVQERRVEDVGERADIPERLLHQRLALGDLPIPPGSGSLSAAPSPIEVDRGCHEILGGSVVEVAGGPASFFVLRLQEASGQLAELALRLPLRGNVVEIDHDAADARLRAQVRRPRLDE